LGLRIGPVSELRRSRQDAPAGIFRDAGLTVQGKAHRGDRYAGLAGNVTNARWPLRSALLTRHGLIHAYDALLPH
jgi:hypothetical protein